MTREARRQLLVAGLIVVAGVFGVVLRASALERRGELLERERLLASDVQANRDRVLRLPSEEVELARCERAFESEKKVLPPPELATEEKVIQVAQAYCEDVQLPLLEIMIRPPTVGTNLESRPTGPFDETSVTMRFLGSYSQIVRFLNLIENHEPLIEVSAFSLSPAGGRDLSATITIRTYRAR